MAEVQTYEMGVTIMTLNIWS